MGTLIGDSLGLPYEGLSASRGARLMPFPLRQRILLRKGFSSDDTAQSAFVLQALLDSHGSEDRFVREFARRLRTWFLSVPPGVGLSTVKACLRLCIGVPPSSAGVNSAGNGAAMRAAVLGAAFHCSDDQRIRYVERCSRVTHTAPLAIQGAQLVALAAALSAQQKEEDFERQALNLCPDWPWETRWPPKGPSGWVVHSVNAVVEIWKRHRHDPVKAIEAAVRLGGDTDSVAAMLGGILGADPRIVWPEEWLYIRGWPNGADIENLTSRVSYWRLAFDHLVQLPVVLAFGFRRLLPPY